MAETTTTGRHRAAGRHNPLSELTGMVARAGESGVKASAVLAASGGLIAAFALPAQAATATAAPAVATTSTALTAAKPAAQAAPAAVSAAPAVVAPQTTAPVALASVGIAGVEAVEKPAPPPPPRVVAATQTSRSAARVSTNTATEAPAATWVAPSVVGGSVLDIAAAYSGIWYVYGGTTPAGFDCSGFTQFVFAQAGVSLPRTATQQLYATTRVSDPQPGDLVFAMSGGIATHVGIYAGNGMQYDSPRTGKQSGLHQIWATNVAYGRV